MTRDLSVSGPCFTNIYHMCVLPRSRISLYAQEDLLGFSGDIGIDGVVRILKFPEANCEMELYK